MLKLASIGLALTLAGTACAQADVSYSFSVDPSSISVGGVATVDLTLAYTPDPGFVFNSFSGDGSILSGDGQEVPVSWDSQTVSFSQPFTYALSGAYSPSFSVEYFFVASSSDGEFEAGIDVISGQAPLRVGVPEAPTWAMMLLGLLGIGGVACTRRRNADRRRLLPDLVRVAFDGGAGREPQRRASPLTKASAHSSSRRH